MESNSSLDKAKVIWMVVPNQVVGDSRVIKSARSLVDAGYRVVILGITQDRQFEQLEYSGLKICRIPERFLKNFREQIFAKSLSHVILEPVVAFVSEYYGFPDLIYSHDILGLLFAAAMNRNLSRKDVYVPWVHDIHEYTRGMASDRTDAIVDLEERYIKEPDQLITAADRMSELISAEYKLERETLVVHDCPSIGGHASDTASRESLPTVREHLSIPDNGSVIVWLGEANYFLDVHTIVEAVSKIENTFLVAITNQEDAYIDTLKELAKRCGAESRLIFAPDVDREDVIEYISTADVGIHAENGDLMNSRVAIPSRLFDYLHSNLSIVVSDASAAANFIQANDLGAVFRSGNVSDAVATIRSVLQSRKMIASPDRKRLISNFSWSSQFKAVVSRVNDLIEEFEGEKSHDLRIAHGFGGAAGQPFSTAMAQRELGAKSDAILLFNTKYGYRCHHRYQVENDMDRLYVLGRLLKKYDVFHLYGGRTIFFSWTPSVDKYLDLLLLRMNKKVVVMNFRGSEVRRHSMFKKYNRFNYVDENPSRVISKIPEKLQTELIEASANLASGMTVVDPELQDYVPGSVVMPRLIDIEASPQSCDGGNVSPLVVHAPTRRGVKGTEFVESSVENLRKKGFNFRFQLLENLSNDELKEALLSADIVVDQLRIGWYGVLSVESMARGKAVISYIREDLQDELRNVLGGDLPVASANPDTIEGVLEELIVNAEKRASLGRRARFYCEMVHDSVKVGRKYLDYYESLLKHNPAPKSQFLAAWLKNSVSRAEFDNLKKFVKKTSSPVAVRKKTPPLFFDRTSGTIQFRYSTIWSGLKRRFRKRSLKG